MTTGEFMEGKVIAPASGNSTIGIHRRLGRKLHPGVKHVLAPAHSFKESTEEPGERSTFAIKREN